MANMLLFSRALGGITTYLEIPSLKPVKKPKIG